MGRNEKLGNGRVTLIFLYIIFSPVLEQEIKEIIHNIYTLHKL